MNPAVIVSVPIPVGALAVFRSLVELVFREIGAIAAEVGIVLQGCLLYTSPSPRD